MDEEGQAELERRVLALLRDYVEETRREVPDGFEIGDFMIIMEFLEAPSDDTELQPWENPSDPGWTRMVSFSTTNRSWWMDEAMATEVLRRTRLARIRFDSEPRDGEDG